ncbi:phosphohistidine phosphatase, SixA [Abditibacterium utsteinense]|uniref:Phosphohistidine phosphatase, SixA n=1 Tax=Abditibacterium utsteinense TaxID=1960156 RepID=A0A2S8SUI0_9BACT|nr:histidine phosphatase family protein [Abditibacterium utsteinense]PQV64438.1 phosphohistidine phosphatase, SixA [Abditibacterium utsteinense]
MLLLLMRHGIAHPLVDSASESFAKSSPADDFHRALTSEGRDRAHRAALGARELVPRLDFLASSPKTRARQTAQIVRDVWGKKSPPLTEWSELMEDDSAALVGKLRALEAKVAGEKTVDAPTILLCGHEPLLSRFVSQLLTDSAETLRLEWKKAGVCALQVEFDPQKMKAGETTLPATTLMWHLTPKQLRKIGSR